MEDDCKIMPLGRLPKTPLEFVQHIAGFQTYEEYIRNNEWEDEDPEFKSTEEELLEMIEMGPDEDWIKNNSDDLGELVLLARKLLGEVTP